MQIGTKLRATADIQISEDCEWPCGTVVEVVELSPNDHTAEAFGAYSVELQAADGSIGSFAAIDCEGEWATFAEIDA